VPPTSPAHREELFGPVAILFRARDRDEVLTIANDTTFAPPIVAVALLDGCRAM
jgi:acyl-CoA reductase-like NAD-dependent aldehyde dehydrogenase